MGRHPWQMPQRRKKLERIKAAYEIHDHDDISTEQLMERVADDVGIPPWEVIGIMTENPGFFGLKPATRGSGDGE